MLGEMARFVGRSKTEVDRLATMEFFYDGIDAIFIKYEAKLTEERLRSANEHAKVILLMNELKETYNELWLARDKIPDVVIKLMSKTKIPTRQDLEQDIQLKHGKENRPQE